VRRNPSYSHKDLPPKFLLALNFSPSVSKGKVDERAPNLAMDLLAGRIEGVKGVSGTVPIEGVRLFGNIREMMLLMPTAEFLRLNKVSRVLYDNPDYLMSNNMRGLKRLFNNKPGDTQQILVKMNDYMAQSASLPMAARYEFRANSPFQTFGYFAEERGWRFNSIIELARGVYRWVHEHNQYGARNSSNYYYEDLKGLSVKDWAKCIREALLVMGGLYSKEKEWLIKGDTLRIPESTVIYVKDYWHRKKVEEYMAGDKWVNLIKNAEDHVAELLLFDDLIKRLREKYRVVILPEGKVQKTAMRLVTKKGFG
jgi:hypothetical protein